MQKSELTNGKGPNGLKEKVRIDQWRRSELTKRKVRIDQRIFLFEVRIDQLKKVQIDQWSGSELTCGRGPNLLGPNFLGSELTKAELAKVRIVHNSAQAS